MIYHCIATDQKMTSSCTEKGCTNAASGILYNGKPLCELHYKNRIKEELQKAYDDWLEGDDPPKRFQYLLGRLSDEMQWKTTDSYLTAARIRDRGVQFVKTQKGCTFEITRHPGAFKNEGVTNRIVQKWEADIHKEQLNLIETHPWSDTDPL